MEIHKFLQQKQSIKAQTQVNLDFDEFDNNGDEDSMQ